MSLDIRPRIVFHPPGGAVVLLVDPTEPLAGMVEFPLLGGIPYRIELGFPVSDVVLTFPMGAEVSIPLDVTQIGSGPAEIQVPVLGAVPYEVVIGPPALAPEEHLGAGWSLTGWPAVLAVIGAAWLLARRR